MARLPIMFRIVAGLMLSLLSLVAQGAACREAATPAGVTLQMLAPDMRMNGMPMNIRGFNSSLSVEGVLAYYRNLWAGLATKERPGSMEQEVNGWKVISTVEGECFTTVQVRQDLRGSYSMISVIKKPDAAARVEKVGADFPKPPGSQTLNDFEYADGVRNARTIVVSNKSNMAANLQFYKNELKLRGWVPLIERQPESKQGVSHVMVLKRGVEETSLILSSAEGQVQIVANIVDRP
jgi:hypothetical protein